MASGWFKDPFGRHEARWISGGTATALVRDGNVEQNDPPPDHGDFQTVPEAVLTSLSSGGSDLRRADAANHGPSPDDERYRTMALDTYARPALFPVPGMEQDYDTRGASRRRMTGALLIVLGAGLIIVGYYLAQNQGLPTQRSFEPSQAEINVVRTGGTAVPPDCSESVAATAAGDGLGTMIGPTQASTQLTVYPHTVIMLNGDGRYTPEVSAPAPACLFDEDFGATGYYLERSGTMTVYFVAAAHEVSVVRIVATSASPPSSAPEDALMILGGLVCVLGLVLAYRRLSDRQPGDDLPRADDVGTARN